MGADILNVVCVVGVLASAVLVIRLENLMSAVMALSAVGTFLTLLFVVLHAPDDAHSEVVVGAIALPVLYLIAISKIREVIGEEPALSEATPTTDDSTA